MIYRKLCSVVEKPVPTKFFCRASYRIPLNCLRYHETFLILLGVVDFFACFPFGFKRTFDAKK